MSPYFFKNMLKKRENLTAVTDNEKWVTDVAKALQIARALAFLLTACLVAGRKRVENGLKNNKIVRLFKTVFRD